MAGFPFPLGPFFTRKTVRIEVERGSVWVFEQTQALELFNVYTPVRMTVIKLASGGLWVHAPVAPTEECIRLIKELDAPVEYIVLPTFAYEHKVFVGPFSRRFPKAKVYVAPYQWSFPINLPPQFFGIFPAGELTTGDPDVPWAEEIEQKLFLPPSIGVGSYVRFSEVAFFHKKSRTLLVTDAVVFVPEDPPEVIPEDALLEIARDNLLARFISGGRTPGEVAAIAQTGPVEDTPAARRKGGRLGGGDLRRLEFPTNHSVPLRSAHPGSAAAAPLERPVVFPPDDMKTLNSLNETLLSLGAVKRNADLEELGVAKGVEAGGEGTGEAVEGAEEEGGVGKARKGEFQAAAAAAGVQRR
ncbi:hypothetical protein VOLCADRAFT_107814 [Volvox carteri f. nagariensis]|uniref:Uncharacterized protein n=1 Tax=Volvox carteri f. nagariensis TaxID=3068 RepID=D8UGM2_VOLCA|nr:uncharacterized protein VOLCADRAFT_107814 [Volvox carteri f. nagariensis]EFJ41123.1 hypothetical protein VOLCADRAFT_107814 [Volvox carteri f. nagariensis]|eukprot:XP_002957795.1 hypothetical protein VOLCADRAFT_107814 [Volvox carteri f. nagariensis]